MIIKTETYQGAVYMLTEYGDIWRVKIAWDRNPILENLGHVGHDKVRQLGLPQLAGLCGEQS